MRNYIGNLQLNGQFNIINLNSNLNNSEYCGIISSGVAIEDVEFGQLLYYKFGSGYGVSDCSTFDKMPSCSICLNSCSNGDVVTVLIYGLIRYDNWGFDLNTSNLFVSNFGQITQQPTTIVNSYIQNIGIKLSKTSGFFNFNSTWLKNI